MKQTYLPSLYRPFGHLYLLLLLVFCSGCDKTRTPEGSLKAAQQYLEAHDYESAQIEVKSGLQKNPNDKNLRLLLARMFIEFGNGEAARTNLDKLPPETKADSEVVVSKLKTSMLLKEYESVIGFSPINKAGTTFTTEERAEIIGIQGIAYLGLNQDVKAKAKFAEALGLDSNCGVALLGQAQATLQAGNVESGTAETIRATELAPKYAPGWSLLGDIYRYTKKIPQAEQAYSKAIELRPINQQDLLLRALTRISEGNLTGAREDISRLRKIGYSVPHAAFAEGLALLRENKSSQAKDSFEQVVSKFPNYMAAVCYLGESLALTKNYERAAGSLKACLTVYPGAASVRRIYTNVLILHNRREEAQLVLAPLVDTRAPESQDLALLAQLKLAQGKPEDAVKLLETALELDKNSGHAYLNLGYALVAAGRVEESRDVFAQARAQNPSAAGARLVEADALLKAGKFKEAIDTLETLRAGTPKDLEVLNMLAIASLQAANPQAAKAYLEAALTVDSQFTAGAANLASIYAQEGNLERAQKVLQPALEREPFNPQILGLSTAIDVNQGHAKSAGEKILKALEHSPNDAGLQLLYARFQKSQGKIKDALDAYAALAKQASPKIEWLREIAMAQLAAEQFASAIKTAQSIVEYQSSTPADRLILARAARNMNDYPAAQHALDYVLASAPNDPSARLEAVRLMVDRREIKDARKAINELKKLVEPHENAEILFTDSRISLFEKDGAGAIKSAERAFDIDSTSERAIELARVYAATGEKAKSINILAKWVTDHPNDASTLFVLADALDKTGDTAGAKKRYEHLLKISPDNSAALNNLAWLLRHDDTDTAFDLVQKALLLSPNAPGYLDTYGMLLLDKGNSAKSVETLRKAAAGAPNNPSITIHLALALSKNGNQNEALGMLEKIRPAEISPRVKQEYEEVAKVLGGSK